MQTNTRQNAIMSSIVELEESMFYQAYAVKDKGRPTEQRELVSITEYKEFAKNRIRDAIASGFDYGYIKQGFETVGYYAETSFLTVIK